MRRLLGLLVAGVLLAMLPAPAEATSPCAGDSTVPTKVLWVVFENRSLTQVKGHAPYIDSLASQCGYASHYSAATHPSLPNYLAMTSGSTHGIKTDCPTFCPVSGPSIFGQDPSWKVYAESMVGQCVKHDQRPYVVHHTAAPYYSALTNCTANDLPLPLLNPSALPRFTLVVPNVLNDMHEGSSSVTKGDTWASQHLPALLGSPDYQAGRLVVFVTWDEGGKGCGCPNTVLTLVLAKSVTPGTVSTVGYTHYSLLRTTEELLGYPLLGSAGSATSMRPGFGL